MSPRILTRQVLATIPDMVASGMNREQIATKLGCKLTTLQVRCSQNRISLRSNRPRRDWSHVIIRLTPEVAAMLHERASANGETDSCLIRRLLEVVARDNLFDAVLDEKAA